MPTGKIPSNQPSGPRRTPPPTTQQPTSRPRSRSLPTLPGTPNLTTLSTRTQTATLAAQQDPLPNTPLENRQAQTPATPGFFKALLSKITSLFSSNTQEAPAPEPTPITLNAGPHGTFALDPASIPPINSQLDPETIHNAIAQKIQSGGDLVNNLLNNPDFTPTTPTTTEDMTNIMWFLYAKAEDKTNSFESGAFSLEDPSGTVLNFLDQNSEVYQRKSSHLFDFQADPAGVHRGIDNNTRSISQQEDLQTILPHSKGTLLYGPMSGHGLDSQRIYLKMEAHGSYSYKPRGGYREEGPTSRPRNAHDSANARGHALSTIRSYSKKFLGIKAPSDSKKERTPKPIKKAYNKLLKDAQALSPQAYQTLTQNTPTANSSGIRIMLANIRNLEPTQSAPIQDPLQNFLDTLSEVQQNNQLDHMDVRIGNEIIFSAADLTPQ